MNAVVAAFRQWHYLADGNVYALDWVATLLVVALGWVALFATGRSTFDVRRGAPPFAIPRWVEVGVLACAAYVCLGLVFAGRHRDFPVWLFLPELGLRIVLTTVIVLAVPALVVVVLGKRS